MITQKLLQRKKQKIFELLENDVVLIFIDYSLKVAGEIDGKIILINPKFGDRIITLIHECLHFLYPYKTDYRIEQESIEINKNLSLFELECLLSFLHKGGTNDNRN